VHLPRGWGCHIPRIRKMSTGAVNGAGLNRSFPNPAFEILISAVKCMAVSSLSLELVRFKFFTETGTDVMILKIFSPKNLAKILAFFAQTIYS
jgi:hypothetical protein